MARIKNVLQITAVVYCQIWHKYSQQASNLHGHLVFHRQKHTEAEAYGSRAVTSNCNYLYNLSGYIRRAISAQHGKKISGFLKLQLLWPSQHRNKGLLGLVGMELTFFTAAHMVVGFRFVTKTALVTHQRFSYCWTVLAQYQGFLFLSKQAVDQKL